MSAIVVVDEDHGDHGHNFQCSNPIFGGVLGFAEDSGASLELVRLLNEGSLLHGVNIQHYSVDTQNELADLMEVFLEHTITKTSDEAYLDLIAEFVKMLAEHREDFKTDFTYLNKEKRFEL